MDVIFNFIRKNGIVGYIIAITVVVFILSLLILGIFKSAGYNLFYDQLTLPLDYGKFIHIMDAEGNKIELWEPM